MLQQFRDQKNSALIVILFGLIIVVFVFMFGLPSVDSCQGKSQGDLGSYASHDISYSLTQSMILKQYDDKIFGTMNYVTISKQMVKSIAVIYMLADEARAAGMRVSDEELRDYLTNWEAGNDDVRYFLTNNHFDQKRYDDTLARYQLSAQQYEDYKREELLARNYLMLLRASIDVSDEELWQDYAIDNAKASLEAVRITPDAVRAIMKPITDADIDAYLVQVIVGQYYIIDPSVEGGQYCMHGKPFVPDVEVTGENVISTDYSQDSYIRAVLDYAADIQKQS